MRSPPVARLRRQFLQDGGLPFAAVLTVAGIKEALLEIKATWYDRIYTPLVTLRVFLGPSSTPTRPVVRPWPG